MLQLYLEISAAVEHGPGRGAGNATTWADDSKVLMYDASRLAREVSPEIQLQYSQILRDRNRIHCLEYIVLKDTGDYFLVTKHSIHDWLTHDSEHIGGLEVEEAFRVLDASISDVDPGQRRVLLKALGSISKALKRRK